MSKIIKYCPNDTCNNHTAPKRDFYRKKGFYKTKKNSHPVPKFQCKTCNKFFSANTFKSTYRQRKSSINKIAFQLLCSGVTQRRAAKILNISKRTLVKRFIWLADLAKTAHLDFLTNKELTSYIHFDEMETFEHTKLKPLSIALAVRPKTGEIIGAKVAEMNAKGHISKKSVEKYGLRNDEREMACKSVLNSVKSIAKAQVTIACDGKTAYPNIIKDQIKDSIIIQHSSRNSKKLSDSSDISIEELENTESKTRKNFDPLFMLNHTCAKLRSDLSRLVRRSWATTKKKEFLQKHLNLYIAYSNGYAIV